MILLARTTPLADVKKKSEGMSIFIVDLREAIGNGLTVRPILNMVNHETNELFFENLRSRPRTSSARKGRVKYIRRPERRAHADQGGGIGDGYWFIDKVTAYTKERMVSAGPSVRTRACSFRSPRPSSRSRPRTSALRRLPPLRRARTLWRAGQHGEVPRLRYRGKRPMPVWVPTAASASPPNTT